MAIADKTHGADRAYGARAGESAVPAAHDFEIHSLSFRDLTDVLQKGYADFCARPSHILVLGLVYPLGAALAAGLALDQNFIQLVFPVAAGLALVGPVGAIVLYEISRRREKGDEFAWSDIGAVFQRVSGGGVAILIAALMIVFGLWVAFAQAIFTATLGDANYFAPLELITRALTTSQGWALIVMGNGVGFLFAASVLATNIVSFPLLLDRDVGAPAAVATSLRVTFKNPVIIALWGLIVALSLVVGALALLVGLGVVVPVLGHATWHLYRKAVTA